MLLVGTFLGCSPHFPSSNHVGIGVCLFISSVTATDIPSCVVVNILSQ